MFLLGSILSFANTNGRILCLISRSRSTAYTCSQTTCTLTLVLNRFWHYDELGSASFFRFLITISLNKNFILNSIIILEWPFVTIFIEVCIFMCVRKRKKDYCRQHLGLDNETVPKLLIDITSLETPTKSCLEITLNLAWHHIVCHQISI